MVSNKPKLKILHLTTHLNIGGISNYILMLSRRMIQAGHEIYVASSGGEMQSEFEKEGVRLLNIGVRAKNELHPKLSFALPKLLTLIKREKIDVIHAHTRVTQVLGSALSLLSGVPLVTTAHGFFKRRLSRKLFDAWGRRVIAISDGVTLDLQKTHHVKSSRIRTVYNGIDLIDFQKKMSEKDPKSIRKEYGIEDEMLVMGCISRLVADKGHTFLIEAFQELKKDFNKIFLVILGDGREREAIEDKIRRKGLEKDIALIPGLRDTTFVFSMIDIFIHPATYREGFGLSIAEAMAAQKPVIASRIPAIDTIIEDGVNGFLVEPADSAALARTIRFVIENKDKAKSVSQNAYNLLIEKYSIESMVSQIESVYREVL